MPTSDSAGELDVVVRGIDPDQLHVEHRPQMGPHITVQVPDHHVSIVPEFDFEGMMMRAEGPGWALGTWDTLPGIVEIALLDADGTRVLGEPLRRVPFVEATEILRRATLGDVAPFLDSEQ